MQDPSPQEQVLCNIGGRMDRVGGDWLERFLPLFEGIWRIFLTSRRFSFCKRDQFEILDFFHCLATSGGFDILTLIWLLTLGTLEASFVFFFGVFQAASYGACHGFSGDLPVGRINPRT